MTADEARLQRNIYQRFKERKNPETPLTLLKEIIKTQFHQAIRLGANFLSLFTVFESLLRVLGGCRVLKLYNTPVALAWWGPNAPMNC